MTRRASPSWRTASSSRLPSTSRRRTPRPTKVYQQLLDSLTALYGPPTIRYHVFAKPYHEGDGNEAAALRNGKARISALWLREAGGKQLGDDISLEITPNVTVEFTYESNVWEPEANRRKTAARQGSPVRSDTL